MKRNRNTKRNDEKGPIQEAYGKKNFKKHHRP